MIWEYFQISKNDLESFWAPINTQLNRFCALQSPFRTLWSSKAAIAGAFGLRNIDFWSRRSKPWGNSGARGRRLPGTRLGRSSSALGWEHRGLLNPPLSPPVRPVPTPTGSLPPPSTSFLAFTPISPKSRSAWKEKVKMLPVLCNFHNARGLCPK